MTIPRRIASCEVILMRSRQRKALYLLFTRKINIIGPTMATVARRRAKGGQENDPYVLRFVNGSWICPCPAYADLFKCKHEAAVAKFLVDGQPESLVEEFDTKRPSYPQDWPKYKAAKSITREAICLMLPALAKVSLNDGWQA
jgi:hypothetical protein